MTILVLSNKWDTSTDLLEKVSQELGIKIVRLNLEDFIIYTKFNCKVGGKNDAFELLMDGEYDILNHVRLIFVRRLGPLLPILDEWEKLDSTMKAQLIGGVFGSLMTLRAKWVSPIGNIRCSQYKSYVLSVAKSIGLKIPDTIVTNDAKCLRDFIKDKRDKKVVIKRPGPAFPEQNEILVVGKNLTSMDELNRILALRHCVICQEFIDASHEVKAVVFGDNIVSFSFQYVKGRKCIGEIPIKPHTLPAEISKNLLILNQKLGLIFAVADLLVNKEGEYYFTEVNPLGQWDYLERSTNIPVTARLLQFLISWC